MPAFHIKQRLLVSVLLLMLGLTCSVISYGQQASAQIEHYAVDAGLPTHQVSSVLQHSSGYLWVGTYQGLCRFDGHRFSLLRNVNISDWIRTGTIYGLAEDSDGAIIMETMAPSRRGSERRYFRFDPVLQTSDSISLEMYRQLHGTAIHSSRDLHSHVDTIDQNLHYTYVDKSGNRLQQVGELGSLRPISAHLTLNTGEQIDLTDTWQTLPYASAPTGKNLGDVIYWGTPMGLIKVSVSRSPFDLILHVETQEWAYSSICRTMVDLNEDSLLVSVESQGLKVYNRNTAEVFPIADGNTALTKAYYRGMWNFDDAEVVYGAHHNDLIAINTAEDIVDVQFQHKHKILATCALDQNRILIGRRKGLLWEYTLEIAYLEEQTRELIEFENGDSLFTLARPTFIYAFSEKEVWYGTKSGLFVLNLAKPAIEVLFLPRSATRKVYPFPVKYTLDGPHAWVIHDSGDGKIWVGLDAAGINIIDRETFKVEHLSTSDGLPNNTVVGFLNDSTGIWISTFNGLSHVDTATMEFRNFYRANGIAHNEFNRFAFMIDRKGKYYFGSMNGITSFYPHEVLGSNTDLKLLVSEIAYYDNSARNLVVSTNYPTGEEIVIPSQNRSLDLGLALSDQNDPANNSFFYKLEPRTGGSSQSAMSWSALGKNSRLRFDNLEAGRYALRLKGLSSSGITSDEVIIPLRVREYFYRTWWFISLCLLMIGSILYGLHRMRMQQVIRMERLRTRLSSDLHDDVGGLLSGVALQMEVLESTVDDKNRRLVKRVAQSSRRAMEQMRDVVWAIDSRQETILDLKERMLEFADEVLSPAGIGYSVHMPGIPERTVLSTEVRHNLLLIFKEFANNTVKHADASKLGVTFEKSGRELLVQMHDDGRGLESTNGTGSGQGLKNMEMRTSRMNGHMEFQNHNGFGIRLRVPIA